MTRLARKATGFLLLWAMIPANSLKAQDTVHISLKEAEKRFIENNLSLMAGKYDIRIAEAQLMQAKLFSNPSINFSGDLYDPAEKRIFNLSNSTGQYDVAVQQLIRLAGKRNKEVKLASTNVRINEARFYDLLRTLRFTLRSNFFDIYYKQKSLDAYKDQVQALEKLDNGYNELQAKGIVTVKDAIRIRSLLYSLRAEIASLQNDLNELEASLQLLLADNHSWFIADNDVVTNSANADKLILQALVDSAYANRNDLKEASYNLLSSNQNYALQKAMAVPDLTVGSEFDKRGSFVDNASFFSVGIDIPIFNRNQGNIKAAKTSITRDKTILDQQKLTVENEVNNAYRKWLNSKKVVESMDPKFNTRFQNLLAGITENFEKKNISLTEFADFIESYRNNVLQYNQLQDQQQQALESLQYAVGTNILYP